MRAEPGDVSAGLHWSLRINQIRRCCSRCSGRSECERNLGVTARAMTGKWAGKNRRLRMSLDKPRKTMSSDSVRTFGGEG